MEFGYNELVTAIADAIDMSERLDGAKVVDFIEEVQEEKKSFIELRNEAQNLWSDLVYHGADTADVEMAQTIAKKVEIIFGRPMKISEITEDQISLMELVVMELKDLSK